MTVDKYLPFGRPSFSPRELDAVARVLHSAWVGMGPETLAFERELAEYIGAPHVVTVNSCSSALFLSLLASGVEPNDEVICPSLTWCSTANAALHAGARPVFCDIDLDTLCLTPELVESKLTPHTKAVIAVHFGGLAADIEALRASLPPRVALIEDAAHAFGSLYRNTNRVGSAGNLTCFSFYANKNLSTGEGGAIALFDKPVADRLRSLRQHALPIDAWKRFESSNALLVSNQLTDLGYKMNYTDLQAAIGRVQLARQDEFFETRLAVAQIYEQGLEGLAPSVQFQTDCTEANHARHLFLVRLPLQDLGIDRNEVVLALHSRNIGAAIHYAPLHTMPLYSRDTASPPLEATEEAGRSLMTLPISASMDTEDARNVVQEFCAVIEEHAKSPAGRGIEHCGFQID